MPETITVGIPTHRLTAIVDDAPTCRTLPLGRNRSTESTLMEYTVTLTILDSIVARCRPRTSNRLIIIIVAPS
jgi:hypothetical protein